MKSFILLLILLISTSVFSQAPAKDSTVLQDDFIKKKIVGKWKDQNSTIVFKKNGTHTIVFDDGKQYHGTWSILNNILSFREELNDDDFSPSISFSAYIIIYFSPSRFEYQSTDTKEDATIWTALKIEKKK